MFLINLLFGTATSPGLLTPVLTVVSTVVGTVLSTVATLLAGL